MILRFFSLSVILAMMLSVKGQTEISTSFTIRWITQDSYQNNDGETLRRLSFNEAVYPTESPEIPWFSLTNAVAGNNENYTYAILPENTLPLDEKEIQMLDLQALDTVFSIHSSLMVSRGNYLQQLEIKTIRLNPVTWKPEKLLSFELLTSITANPSFVELKTVTGLSESVLSSGNWYKVKFDQTGMYQLTGAELKLMGISLQGLDPAKISLYGNPGGLLPSTNADPRPIDLNELAIEVFDGNDGKMDETDFLIFYGQGPTTWKFNSLTGNYSHQVHYYDDYSYVFITIGEQNGKRITSLNESGTEAGIITEFPDYQVINEDLYNLTNTGRLWFGDLFDVSLSRNYSFDFPNLVTGRSASVAIQVAGRTLNSASFQVTADGNSMATLPIPATSATSYSFARLADTRFGFTTSATPIQIGMTFSRATNTSRGWLDFIEINAWRSLVMSGNQMLFRNPLTTDNQEVFKYLLGNTKNDLIVWEVTDPLNPKRISGATQNGSMIFSLSSTVRHECAAFYTSGLFRTSFVEKVSNQNLHAVKDIDYLIVTHPDFISQADRLADIHRKNDGLVVYVTTPQTIYNEFSTGAQDVSAIRDFARHLYTQNSTGRELRYLLLFGDGSFDYKDKIGGNSNYVPTWETITSLDLVGSIATDDYFGFMDDEEGDVAKSLVDIGIGRLPVGDLTQATQMVDKVEHYLEKTDEVMGPWRNFVTFVADDGDGNLHLNDAETLSNYLATSQPSLNIDKIYLDSYPQIATNGGQKAPQMNEAINNRLEKGSLIMNYSGHGGEIGWGHERTLEISDINSWQNFDKMPVFITATCEFSRYDDPTRVSAGELVILNPKGGAIAMFTTSRATYASANLTLNKAIYEDNMFLLQDGEYPRFGDILRRSKLRGDDNDRKFVLLGDPALHLAFAPLNVQTTHINHQEVSETADTLHAYDIVTIGGMITDLNNNLLSDFQGIVYPSVFDKAIDILTYGDQNPQIQYELRNSLIYKGKAAVVDGKFEFSFMMPKDISYNFGAGRISYYATDLKNEAKGYYENIIIGGFNETTITDNTGPDIQLFMNDTTFINGGTTHETPTLLAMISDQSGINTTGNGIGHDITASLTGPSEANYILNEFYEADLNKSNSGSVRYLLPELNPGLYTLTLKAWDVFNNSSVSYITFEVINSGTMELSHLINYPNPFTNETSVVFDHNQAGNNLEVQLSIYNLTGQKVRTIEKQITGNAFRSEPIKWDGRNDGGDALPEGLYIYSVFVTNEKGESNEKHAKMLFVQ